MPLVGEDSKKKKPIKLVNQKFKLERSCQLAASNSVSRFSLANRYFLTQSLFTKRFYVAYACLKHKSFFFYQNEETGPFKAFVSTLQSNISALHASLVEVNVAQLSDDLLELNLVELDNEVKFYFRSKEKLCRISSSTR